MQLSTLTLSKCGTNKTTATYATQNYATIGNPASAANYNAQFNAQMTPINTTDYLLNHQPSTSNNGYQEIGYDVRTYDLETGGLNSNQISKSNHHTPHHHTPHHSLSTFGHGLTIRSDISTTQSSDNDEIMQHQIQVKSNF